MYVIKLLKSNLTLTLIGYEPNGYEVWNAECEKFVVFRNAAVNETNLFEYRPLLKLENNFVKSQNNTEISDRQN